jgi:iron complex outermembrane receptor protein
MLPLNNTYWSLLWLLIPFLTFSQNCNLTLSGYLLDEDTGLPLANANIILEETQNGSVSNDKGYFEIKSICANSYHVRVSHVGCEPYKQFVSIDKNLFLNLNLHHHTELMDEVVVHGKKNNNTTQTNTTISKEEISLKGNKNLSDILEDVTGVRSIKNGSGISKPVIQGLYGNRITILNNGISQSGQQWGNDHAPEIDPFVAQHISVIKGTNALAYSGSSLGGIILVEPSEITEEPHVHGQSNYLFQTNGLGHTLNVQLEQKNKYLAWRTVGTVKKIGDTKAPDYYLTNTGKNEINGAIQLERNFSNRWKTDLYYSIFNSTIGILRGSQVGSSDDLEKAIYNTKPYFTSDSFSYSINAPKQEVAHHLLKIQNKFSFSENTFWTFNYGGQLNNRKEFDVRRNGRSEIAALSLQQKSHFLESVYLHTNTNGLHIKSGIQFTFIDNTNIPGTGILPLIPDYLSYQTGAFGLIQKQKNNWLYELGGRLDHKYFSVAKISNERTIENYLNQFHNYSISGGIKYQITSNVKISLNSGYVLRSPEINELYSNGLHQGVSGIEVGNANLKSEKSFKTTLTTDWRFADKLFIQLANYYQNISDYIYLQPQLEFRNTIRGTFPVFAYEQTNARIFGFDCMASYELSEKLKWMTKYSFIKGDDFKNKIPLVGMPANNLTNSLKFNFNDFKNWKNTSTTLSGQYVFKQTHLLVSQDFIPAPSSYFLLGLQAASSYQMKKTSLKLSLRAENLLNTSYRDYLNRLRYFANEMGINITGGINYTF